MQAPGWDISLFPAFLQRFARSRALEGSQRETAGANSREAAGATQTARGALARARPRAPLSRHSSPILLSLEMYQLRNCINFSLLPETRVRSEVRERGLPYPLAQELLSAQETETNPSSSSLLHPSFLIVLFVSSCTSDMTSRDHDNPPRALEDLPTSIAPYGPIRGAGNTTLATRVMSPNTGEILTRPWGLQIEGPDTTMFYCEVCERATHDLYVCSACYRSGHHGCLKVEVVGEYAFCEQCSTWAIAQYSNFNTDSQRQRWSTRLARQLASWRETAVTTQGVASAVGLALGSGVAMMEQGTAAFVKGAVEGIATAVSSPGVASSSGGPQPGLPAPDRRGHRRKRS